ncbi:unnamed protein product [Knipowitschia caucasica]
MKAAIFVCLIFLILRTDAQTIPEACIGSNTNREPRDTDIEVTCGTEFMDLSILLCPIYQANYNESLLILNEQTQAGCKGIADFTASPPVVKFRFSLNKESLSSCNNKFNILDFTGAGNFLQFSNVQAVNISGSLVTTDPTLGLITYRPQITYMYSCQYPLQYIINNTALNVAGLNIAQNENNGSFINTLRMRLFDDNTYSTPLIIPTSGLDLKKQVFVEVRATNLSDRFNVLLDRCFATVAEYPEASSGYDLFVGCDFDPQTQLQENGDSQTAKFVFEAFRFMEHKNMAVSSFYLHCITRLCNVSACESMKPVCSETGGQRRRREAEDGSAMVTSPLIVVGPHVMSDKDSAIYDRAVASQDDYSSPVVAVIVCVAILSLLLVVMGAYFTWNLRHKLRL